MRKTLLIAGAALAAGVISSQAQGVYSQNIVGYVNAPIVKSGYVNMAIPLDASGGNTLTNLIANPVSNGSGLLDGAYIFVWGGRAYTTYSFDSGAPGGFDDSNGNQLSVSPTVNPGTFFFLQNNTGNATTNTFVGTVHVDGAATGSQVVGTTTNVIISTGAGYNFLASKLPIAGGISSVLQISNPPSANGGPLDGAYVYVANIDANGNFKGYITSSFDSTCTTGFDDGSGNPNGPEPTVSVGQGFIIQNNTGAPYTWVQGL